MKIKITEEQYRSLFLMNENDELTNKILDKINKWGIGSLTNVEKKLLDNRSKDVFDGEVEDLVSIDSGYEFNDTIDDMDVKFIYSSTEEWDENPPEYKHEGELIIDGEEFSVNIYTDEDYEYQSFDLHDGNDYVELDDELTESLEEFFTGVCEKIGKSM